ncbi:unnamed protein product [Rotaria sp. Silwood1]|nr:unnamed protein product [Rotaria sp. Silwood1]
MTAFARPSLLDNRYAVIAETSAYTYDDDDLVNYAEFLRNHGRYMTKGGYVDSSRRIRSLHRQQDDFQISKHQTSPSRGGLLASINKSSLSAPAIGTTSRKYKTSDENELPSSLSLATILENKKKEYDKQMKLIEEEMIKAKQSEREAKRLEGDIKKEQRQLHHSLRDLDVDATRKRYNAEKHLSKNLEDKDKIEREFVKKREKQTKQRTDHIIDSLQTNKDKDRRNLLLCNDLARQYRTKAHELQIKHQQLNRIHTDFEQKVQQRELEESRLKKELADIATALNLEAQKVKTDMKDFLNVVDYDRSQIMKQDLEQEQKFNQFNDLISPVSFKYPVDDNLHMHSSHIHHTVQSVGVLCAALLIKFKPQYKLADPICTFIFSILVLITTITIMRDIIFVLMEAVPSNVNYSRVVDDLLQLPGVQNAHSLHIWSLSLQRTALSVHIAISPDRDCLTVLRQAQDMLRYKHSIARTTIQIEPYDEYVMNACEDCRRPDT